MWIFSAIANAVGRNFIGRPNYLFDLLFNRVKADGGVTEAQQCTIEELTDLQNDNLLSSASLVLTPSSYKEGKLYSIIPENGDGDFTFTRATTATRVNSDGLVELVPYNLVRYSQEFNNAAWGKSGSGGGLAPVVTANAGTAPDGTLTAERVQFDCVSSATSAFRSLMNQSNSAALGNSYTGSIYVKAYAPSEVGKQLRFVAEGANISTIITITADWQRVVVTGSNSTLASINYLIETRGTFTTNTTADVLLWGAQLVEGTNALPYQKTETRLNIPRLDYSLGGCPNILLEPQRTNLALQSSSFDSATWVKEFASITANTTTSPSGIQDADTFTANGTSNLHSVRQTISVVSGTTYTTTIYAKKGTNNFLQILGSSVIYPATVFANFDLENGVVGSVGAATTSSIQSVGNGWYRCSMTATATATVSSAAFFLTLVNSATSVRAETNALSTSVFLWGAQLEAGSYATSYIPTTSASVTRNADILTRNNIYTNGLISASGGTWFIELKNNTAYTSDSNVGAIFLDTASFGYTNGLLIRKLTSNRIRLYSYASAVGSTLYQTATDNVKIAIKWNGTTADVFVNGVKEVSSAPFTITNMQFLSNNTTPFSAYISSMLLYPTPLTDDQLEALTGEGFDTYAAMASYYNYTLQ